MPPPAETHPIHFLPQQASYPGAPPAETHPNRFPPQQTLDPTTTAFQFPPSQSPRRPIPDTDLSDHGPPSLGYSTQVPWQQTSNPVVTRHIPDTYKPATQLPSPVLEPGMSRDILRQQTHISYQ